MMNGFWIVCALPVAALAVIWLVHAAAQGDAPRLAARIDPDEPALTRRPLTPADLRHERYYEVTTLVADPIAERRRVHREGGLVVYSTPTMRGFEVTAAYRMSVRGGVL